MNDASCLAPEQHHLHLCELKAKELKEEVRRLFEEPAHFACSNCGAKVSRAENVCAPKALR
jgi:hypothetical protein